MRSPFAGTSRPSVASRRRCALPQPPASPPLTHCPPQVLAAHRAGIRTLLLPYKNQKDVDADLPVSVKADLTFIYIRTIWEALEGAFGDHLWDGADGEMLRNRVQDFTESRL